MTGLRISIVLAALAVVLLAFVASEPASDAAPTAATIQAPR